MSRKIQKILICSWLLSEDRGGVAMVTRLLAKAFQERGLNVTILTCCPKHIWDLPGITVYHNPSRKTIWAAWRQADAVIMQGNIIKLSWPLFLLSRKVLLVRHIMKAPQKGVRRFLGAWLERKAQVCTVSEYMKTMEQNRSVQVVPNPYNASVFFPDPSVERQKELIFVGRVVPDKGVTLLLNALKRCFEEYGTERFLTLVGENEMPEIAERLTRDEFLRTHTHATGSLPSREIAQLLRQHRIAVIPSIWQEPFGIVALEALACGCRIIFSRTGGLPEAAGGCGTAFENGNEEELAKLLAEEGKTDDPALVAQHLERHTPTAVADFYLALLQQKS